MKRTLSSIFSRGDFQEVSEITPSKKTKKLPFSIPSYQKKEVSEVFSSGEIPDIDIIVGAVDWAFKPNTQSTSVIRPVMTVGAKRIGQKNLLVVTLKSTSEIVVNESRFAEAQIDYMPKCLCLSRKPNAETIVYTFELIK